MKVCGKRDILVPECSDCSELEERVEAVEECCDDAHDEIDTLATDKADKGYVDLSIENVNETIEGEVGALNERIDNIITASEPSVTTLWEGVMESIGDSANLSEDVNDFDYLDIYYRTSTDESEGYYNTVRIPADQFANYTITVGGTMSPLAESPTLNQYLTQVSFVDDTATIDNIREWSWNGSQSSDASDDMQAVAGVTIYRIDGVKEAGGSLEIADAREGVDGTIYPSLGDAIRGQIQDTRDMIQPCPVQDVTVNGTSVVDQNGVAVITMPELVKTVNGNPIVIDDALGEVKKLDVELTPIQDLHGYSKPWAGGAGKNKLQIEDGTKAVSGVTFTQNADGSIIANGTATAALIYSIKPFAAVGDLYSSLSDIWDIKADTQYILSGTPTGYGYPNCYLQLLVYGSGAEPYDAGSGSSPFSFTQSDIENKRYRLAVRIASGTTLNNVTIKPMIRLASDGDNTWTPYANICPITGHDSVTVTDTGKNLFNSDSLSLIPVSASSTKYGVEFTTAGTYTVSGKKHNTDTYLYARVRNADGTYDATKYIVTNTSQTRYTFTITDGQTLIVYSALDFTRSQTIALFDYAEFQVEYGNTETDYSPYHGQSKTVTLPHTVYGAGVGVTSGSGKEKMAFADLGDATWNYNTSLGNIFIATSATLPAPPKTAFTGVCTIYSYGGAYTALQDQQFGYVYGDALCVKDSRFTDATAFKQAMSGVKLCYEKTTPTDLQTTPTDITLYNGDNVISSDGDMELSYVQDMAIVIRKIESQL